MFALTLPGCINIGDLRATANKIVCVQVGVYIDSIGQTKDKRQNSKMQANENMTRIHIVQQLPVIILLKISVHSFSFQGSSICDRNFLFF